MIRTFVILWLLGCAGYGIHVAREAVGEREHPSVVIYMFGVGAFTAFLMSGMLISMLLLVTCQLGHFSIEDY